MFSLLVGLLAKPASLAALAHEPRPSRSLTGAGPRIALWTLPVLAVALAAIVVARDVCRFPLVPRSFEVVLAGLLLAPGVALYLDSAFLLLRDFKRGVLVTSGAYAWCQNPLYAGVIVFMVPAVALLVDAWPLLLVGVWMYVGFRRYIGAEYDELERAFGTDYHAYRARTPELLPRPPHHARPLPAH